MNEPKKLNVEKKSESKSKKFLKTIWTKMKDLVDLFVIPRYDDEIGTDSRSTAERSIEKTGEIYHDDIKRKEKEEKAFKEREEAEEKKKENK